MEVRTERWHETDIRFVNVNGEWWCVCDDLFNMIRKLDDGYFPYLKKNLIDRNRKDLLMRIDLDGKAVDLISELGVYEIFYLCDTMMETVDFRHWSGEVMAKLRSKSGLQQYEVLRMLDRDIQNDISRMLDTLYWDDEKKMLMQSVTVQSGDVEQIPFME